MKKTLIALATAAVATGAMAQNVTISGSLDYAAINNGKTTVDTGNGTASTSTKTSATAALNSWTTNQISFSGTEDLGGGLKASFVLNSGIADSGIGSRDVNLALAGSFGTVRMGRFVPAAAAGFHSLSGAASTAQGSIYGMLASSGAAADRHAPSANMAAGNFERNNNNVQYTSPNINGFTVNANYGVSSSDDSAANRQGKNESKQQGISVNYAAGALTIGLGMQDRKVNNEQTNSAAQNSIKGDLNWIGASYNFGVATVFATQVKRKDVTTTAAGVATTNADIKVTSMGVSVPMGAITLAASTYTGKDARGAAAADNTKLSGHQVSVRYALSKRTTAYALVGENKIARDAAAGTAHARKATSTLVGVMHTF